KIGRPRNLIGGNPTVVALILKSPTGESHRSKSRNESSRSGGPESSGRALRKCREIAPITFFAGCSEGELHGSRRSLSRQRLPAVTSRKPPGLSTRAISLKAFCGK